MLLAPVNQEHKLRTNLQGPFLVLNHTDAKYNIKNIVTHTITTVHISRLRPYYHRDTPDALSQYSVARRDTQLEEVEAVLSHKGHRRRKTNMTFEVRLVDGDITWETWDVMKTNTMLHDYLIANRMKSLIAGGYKNHTEENAPVGNKRTASNLR